jgi:hypothetical protein
LTNHEKNTETTTNYLTEIHLRTGGVDVAPLIQEVLDGLVGGKNNHDLGSNHEGVYWPKCNQYNNVYGSIDAILPIFLCPLLKLKVAILSRHLMKIPDQW